MATDERRREVAENLRYCAEELALKRNLAPAQVSARTGLRIEACRHIFRRLGIPY